MDLLVSPDAIELEEESPELEFKVMDFSMAPPQSFGMVKNQTERNQEIEALLNDGWQIDEKIICPPYVMIIFSREKETNES